MRSFLSKAAMAGAALALLAYLSPPANAQIVDPATIHVGTGAGTGCATGCGNDPNQVSSTNFDLYQNSGGAPSLTQPVLLIFGVPNNPTNSITGSAVSAVTLFSPYTGSATGGTSVSFTFGTTAFGVNAASGLAGEMTSGDVYGFLGLGAQTTNSNSFTNWAAADLAINGITATNFSIYVFALNTSSFAGKDLLDITGSLPIGTFVVGYGQAADGTPYATPFTEAGLTTTTPHNVPEPGAILLFGTGLLALGWLARRTVGARAA